MAMRPSSDRPRNGAENQLRYLVRASYLATAVGLAAIGVGIILGPKSNSSYVVLRQWPGGLWGWGVLFITAAVTKIVILVRAQWGPSLRYGSIIGAVVTLGWVSGLLAAGRHLSVWASIGAYLTVAVVQLLGSLTVLGNRQR